MLPAGCYPFLGEGSPTKLDWRKKGTLILSSLLEDVVEDGEFWWPLSVSGGNPLFQVGMTHIASQG